MDDKEEDFMTLGDSMYSDGAQESLNVLNSVSFTRNRAKITNPKVVYFKSKKISSDYSYLSKWQDT